MARVSLADPLPVGAAVPAPMSIATVRRAVLWGLLASKLIAGWGVQWDIQWHVQIGRDSFWIAPHLMTYAGVGLAVLLSWGVVAWESWLRARRATIPREASAVQLLGLTATRGFHLAAWGIALTVLAAPIDDLWHRLFGIDVTIWSPPHLLGILGSVVNTIGCLLISREAYPVERGRRLAATLLSGAMLYGGLHLVVDPSNLVAYRHGGLFFYTLAILSASILPLALVTTSRVSGTRWAPLVIVAVLIPIGLIGAGVARVGFAALAPVSAIHEVIASEPDSPIAVAHAIARKNGTAPGRTGGVLHIFALVPAAVMALVNARRRPRLATVGYAVALFFVLGRVLASRPAFAPMEPGAIETAVALAITVVAAALSAGLARRLSEALVPPESPAARLA